jgi:hypothetical protein
MSTTTDPYIELATVYIRLVRRSSPAAALTLARIRELFGDYTAYRAAFAVVLLRRDIAFTGEFPLSDKYEFLLQDCAAALPLAEKALREAFADICKLEVAQPT